MNTRAARVVGCLSAWTAVAALSGGLALSPGPAAAQTGSSTAAGTPTVQQMIDALKPQASRSRNLLVRPAEPQATLPATAPGEAPGAAPGATAATTPVEAPSDGPAGLSLAVPFDSNSAQLLPASGAVLGELVAALLSPELQDARFVIEGHTDARGNAAANLRLSQQRAESVRQFLIALGVAPARLRAVGKGATEPLDPARPEAAENRRVRVVPVS